MLSKSSNQYSIVILNHLNLICMKFMYLNSALSFASVNFFYDSNNKNIYEMLR